MKKVLFIAVTIAAFAAAAAGCKNSGTEQNAAPTPTQVTYTTAVDEPEIKFGYDGEPFVFRLEDNNTAAAILRYRICRRACKGAEMHEGRV